MSLLLTLLQSWVAPFCSQGSDIIPDSVHSGSLDFCLHAMGDDGSGDGVSGCGVLLHWVSGITSTSEDRFTLQENPELAPTLVATWGTRLSKRHSYQSGSQVVASLSVSSSSSIRPSIETSHWSHAHLPVKGVACELQPTWPHQWLLLLDVRQYYLANRM